MIEHHFTSESVSEGHPDKIADQISDAVLDAVIERTAKEFSGDARQRELWHVRSACETLVKTGMTLLAGEMRSPVPVDYEALARDTIRQIGYSGDSGFDPDYSAVICAVGRQSGDIARGIDHSDIKRNLGAGDQGMMFGYACSETPEKMPAPIMYAHKMVRRQARMRRLGKKGGLPWLRPDAKSQVTFKYRGDRPVSVEAVVLSTQHDPAIGGRKVVANDKRLRQAVIETIIRPALEPRFSLPPSSKIHVNPTGLFVEGGPVADCGLTGRKIIVDTYGGRAPHGGGAFSGKDPSKVDRSGAYVARYVAKNVVAAGLADRCLVQLAYAIGVAEPVSVMADTFGTARKGWDDAKIARAVNRLGFLTPGGIIERLDLWRPIYKNLAAYGHFGRSAKEASWERLDLADELR